MTVYDDELNSGVMTVRGFTLPTELDESTKAVVRMTRNGYSHDYEMTYFNEHSLMVTDDVPEDIKSIGLGILENSSQIRVQDFASVTTEFEVLSFEQDGSLIYP